MTTTELELASKKSMQRRARFGSFVGTTIEWYDFYLYGTAAALVFPQLFFPSESALTGTLLALLTYAAGFVSRPLGGIIMGHFGDRVGRKAMLVTSLLIMGVATTLIGALPTHQAIGMGAPLLLLTLRIIQGIGLGGEWGGAVLVAVEHAPEEKRGLFGAWPQVGAPVGLLLANGVFTTLNFTLTEEAFMAWGWRVGFLSSAVLIVVGLVIRLKMEETPDFKKVQEHGKVARFPLVQVLRRQWRQVLLAIGIKISQVSLFYILTVFSLTYVSTSLGLPRYVALIGVLVASGVSLCTTLLSGWFSDEFGRRRVYLIGAVLSGVFAIPLFFMMDSGSAIIICAAIVIGMIFHDLMYGPQAAFMTELFEPEHRYTGASLGSQVASTISGGFSPVIAVLLLDMTGGKGWVIGLFIAALSAVTIAATFFSPETHRGNRNHTK
ncbi:MHS family MFS transporter [Glutamicibacter sp. JL.03c]|uniref:MFS transporter n=1 Tax=Glutamicibacter sp. JL.03c TaxID=2984842 RepID=UPI0021F7E219|nr:MFS transporter [Glutamicibacter sp. JL.03c]UYQ77760.1 MHS family MFS transporter [Glutamicibacter sp. JL.03c]